MKHALIRIIKGTYEILISDNGWHNNVNVLDLVKSINNKKVRYIRTPFDLSLPKSFEFASENADYVHGHLREERAY